MDNLRRRKKILVNTCPMCFADKETVDYLLLNCKMAQGFGLEFWVGLIAVGLILGLSSACLRPGSRRLV